MAANGRHQSICEICVMDDSDPAIEFLGSRGCNHCQAARQRLRDETFTGARGERLRQHLIDEMKAHGRGRDYDCMLGVSGGVDSSYLAWLATKQWGLRLLALHVDTGWNSDLAVRNIDSLVTKLGIDLHTHVLEWPEIRDLQRAFFRASVIDIEMVCDHPYTSILYKTAARHGIKYVLSGGNVVTESILPEAWAHDKRDAKNIRAVHRKFGEMKLKRYPFLSPAQFVYYVFGRQIKYLPLLNYVDYSREQAMATLTKEIDWIAYPRKHGEGRFTRFFQEYILPTKFGVDKRKAHYSSMIASGLMTREEALANLNRPLYRPDELEEDKEFVLKKLGFSAEEFEAIMELPIRSHEDYGSDAWLFSDRNPLYRFARRYAKAEAPPTAAGVESWA